MVIDPLSPDDGGVARAGPSLSGQLADSRRLRILALGDVFPWPARDGYRLRFASVLRALAKIGDIDLFVGAFDGEDDVGEPPSFVDRCAVVAAPLSRPSAVLAIRTVRSRLPRRILWREWGVAQLRLRRFVRAPYDLVWYSHADSFVALGDPAFGPAVVDLDNLENFVLRRPSRSMFVFCTRDGRRTHVPRLDVHALARWPLSRRDIRCWSWLQQRIADEAASTVVCSDLDRRRLMASTVEVVPNGYEDPGPSCEPVTRSLDLVMVGHFTYEPNLDGAAWFVRSVLPHLRRLVPEVSIRLVGRHDDRLAAVATVPGVTIVGEVNEVGPELRRARGAVVPLLSGSGTRIKVLEALAYGLPIVTTGVGCEGIGVQPGRHALVCEDPLAFAAACHQLLTDDALCERLRVEGRRLYLDSYGADAIADRVCALARKVALAPPGS
jgi:glycosyltransferase involved in cell wall biosynthesis